MGHILRVGGQLLPIWLALSSALTSCTDDDLPPVASGGAAGVCFMTLTSGSGPAPCPIDPTGCYVGNQTCLPAVASHSSATGTPWWSSFFLVNCAHKLGAYCAISRAACPPEGASTVETFPIGGEAGQHYKVTFDYTALAEAKEYEGGTRDQGERVPDEPDTAIMDTFYRDGAPTSSTSGVWKLSVFDPLGVELRHYFMNAFPPGMGFESRRLFMSAYAKTIVVVGGGTVTHSIQDSDCLAVDNCGPGLVPDDFCESPRSTPSRPSVDVPLLAEDPVTHEIVSINTLNEASPGAVHQPWHAQMGHLMVTSVERTSDPVTTDYP